MTGVELDVIAIITRLTRVKLPITTSAAEASTITTLIRSEAQRLISTFKSKRVASLFLD
jgi:hypothetical protein